VFDAQQFQQSFDTRNML